MTPLVSHQISKIRTKFQSISLKDPETHKELEPASVQINEYINYIVTTLMFDELEIACWIKFTDKFNLVDDTYATHDP